MDMFDRDYTIIKRAELKDVVAWLAIHFVFGVDTETEGMMNFENKVIMLQIGDAETQYVIDTRGLDISCLREFFESSKWLKIFHNAKFDINFLRFTFGFRTEGIYDTFLAECCITNGIDGRTLGLGGLTSKYCNGAILDKTERGRFVGLGSKPYTHSNIVYGARDVEYLPCIMDKQKEEIERWELAEVVALECRVVQALGDIEYNGMVLNVDKWIALASKAESKMVELEKALDQMVMEDAKLTKFRRQYVQTSMFSDDSGKRTLVKWSSPVQVLKVLKVLGIQEDTSSEKEIVKYQNKIPLVKVFLDYKHEQKLTTTYGEDFLGYINKRTGRIHTSFWQILDTHRVSSSEPNMQQIPARKEYLSCFVAPRGYKIVGADFSGQELRLIAQGSQDPLWLDAFNNGRDLHGELAALIFGIPLSEVKNKPEYVFVGQTKVYLREKSPRDVTKTINFMLAYGGSKFKLSDTLGISIDEADAIITRYFSLVPKVKAFLDALATYGLRNKYIRSYKPYSIVRQFQVDLSDMKKRGEIERASKNTPIQASGAMMCKLAMVKLREEIQKAFPYNVEMFLQVHDAIFCYVEESYAEEWAEIQKRVMEEAGSIWLKSVPCISDVNITEYWSK